MQNKEYFEKEAQELRIELMKLKEENRVYQEILFDFLSAKVRHVIPTLPNNSKCTISIPEKHFEVEVDYETFVHKVRSITNDYNRKIIKPENIGGVLNGNG